jgi:hypothetical protein
MLSFYNPDFSQQASSNVKILACSCTSGSSLSEFSGAMVTLPFLTEAKSRKQKVKQLMPIFVLA